VGKPLRSTKNKATAFVLAFLLISTSISVLIFGNVNAENITNQVGITQDGSWLKIQDDQITVLVPSSGKPMFLWWYSNDTAKIYVVKYRGLIEYMTLGTQYYENKYEANAQTV
jgi:hypothetical protein